MTFAITPEFIAEDNARLEAAHNADLEALSGQLDRRGQALEPVLAALTGFGVALPSWGVGTGGTRFARFPGPGEPRHIFDKIDDCATVHALTQTTPRVSPHIPWDRVSDLAALRQLATARGLGFDAMNSNTFQDMPGQAVSYKFGSLTHTDPGVRAAAIALNLECIEIGQALGSTALTVWIADGSNFPGQSSLGAGFDRYVRAMQEVVAAAPADWKVFLEHKIYEPAFYSTVISDWGSSLMAAQELGPKALCLVDLGHHAPTVNIEQIVARLIRAGKLGGFHFNDSKYGDDDLDAGAIDPFRLFLVFNELEEAATTPGFSPAHMIDQSHNVTDPIESLMLSAVEIARAAAQALLVDRAALAA
ncbi:MAG: TIM barrel protein, partial [Pseudomonadota bacterium]